MKFPSVQKAGKLCVKKWAEGQGGEGFPGETAETLCHAFFYDQPSRPGRGLACVRRRTMSVVRENGMLENTK